MVKNRVLSQYKSGFRYRPFIQDRGGPITRVNVTEGQFVRKGEVVAEMDLRDYQHKLLTETKRIQTKQGLESRTLRLTRKAKCIGQ